MARKPDDAVILRKSAEEILRENAVLSSEKIDALSPEEIQQTFHELRLHQIELEMQNEELRLAQVELDAIRSRYFDLYDLAPVGYCTLSEQGLILEANLTIATLLGSARNALNKQPFSRHIFNEDQNICYLLLKQLFETGKPQACELRMVKNDGVSLWVHLEANTAQDVDGIPVCHVALSDITQCKRTEDALQESEKKFRLITENTADLISILDMNLRFTYVGPAIMRLRGFTVEECMAQTLEEVLTPESMRIAFAVFEEEMILEASGTVDPYRTQTLELEEYRKDGSIVWMEVNFSFLRDKDLKPVEILTVSRDITERRYAERLLQESDERFKLAMDASKDGLYDWNLLTNEIYYSPGWKRMLGYEPDEIKNEFSEWERLTEPENVKSSWKMLNEVIERTRERFEQEFKMRHKNGTWVDILSRANVYRDGQGKAVRVVGTHMEITERKRVERALRESEEQYRDLIENCNDLICTHDLSGRILSVNQNALRMLGYERQELLQMNMQDIIIPEKRPVFHKYIDAIKINGAARGLMFVETASAEQRIWEYNNTLRTEGVMEPIVRGIARDVTKQKQTERELLLNEEKYRTLFCSSSDAILLVDVDSMRVIDANKAAENLYGYTHDELLQMTAAELSDEVEKTKDALQKSFSSHIPIRYHRRKDGKVFPVEVTANHFELNNRKINLSNIRDISKRIEDDKEKQELEIKFQQAQKMESIGSLAGGVAHDFNNMLTIVIGYVELAMEKVNPSQSLHEDLEEIRNAADRSAGLTRQLLAFARKQVISPVVLDLNETIEGMLKMLRRLIGEDIDLVWMQDKRLWQVMMDPSQIDQILANLCVNARDAISSVGKMTIETGNRTFDPNYCNDHPGFLPGEFVKLGLSDNGCGMDKETQLRIFEPFFTTKEMGKGTGLGLATVYGIVKQNNGFITVSSEPNQGTTFKIYLPRHMETDEKEQKTVSAGVAATGIETILLVEDEKAILKMTSMMLELLGYTVLTASTPSQAIRISESYSGRIDLLITDVVMPEMNGRELAEKLLHLSPNLKCLYMSGYNANAIAHHGVLDKGVHFIHKPFTKQDLANKLREVLDK